MLSENYMQLAPLCLKSWHTLQLSSWDVKVELSPHSEGTGLDWSFEACGETWVSKCGGHYLACTIGGSSLFLDSLRILTSGIITSRSVGYSHYRYSSWENHCWKIHLWINRNMYWGWLCIYTVSSCYFEYLTNLSCSGTELFLSHMY